jgi:hypothetical protein
MGRVARRDAILPSPQQPPYEQDEDDHDDTRSYGTADYCRIISVCRGIQHGALSYACSPSQRALTARFRSSSSQPIIALRCWPNWIAVTGWTTCQS